jgi:hypothetical protein
MSLFHGQVAVTGSAQQLDSSFKSSDCHAFVIKAPLSNNVAVFIGASTVTSGNGFQLDPGDEFTYERIAQNGQPRYEQRVSDFYAVGTSGDVVTWLASQ